MFLFSNSANNSELYASEVYRAKQFPFLQLCLDFSRSKPEVLGREGEVEQKGCRNMFSSAADLNLKKKFHALSLGLFLPSPLTDSSPCDRSIPSLT